MYERMLDKRHEPTEAEFSEFLGTARERFERLDAFLRGELKAQRLLRFPYGNRYGWGMKYSIKSRHVCDVFAERDAFTVMLRLRDEQFAAEYGALTPDTQKCVDGKYPCGDGGWARVRVLTAAQLGDVERLLQRKAQT